MLIAWEVASVKRTSRALLIPGLLAFKSLNHGGKPEDSSASQLSI
jgi:hypothetical protein